MPNILLQMLRASNAGCGYPDNVVTAFVKEARRRASMSSVSSMLGKVPNMRVAMNAVREAGAICEATICYSVIC